MKYILKNKIFLPLLLIIVMVIGSCKKEFLEVVPKGRLIAEKTSDYDKILNSTTFTNFSMAPIYTIMGDEVVARDPLFGARPALDQRLFRYEDDIFDPEQEPTQITTLTRLLYLCNKIINEVMDSKGGTIEEKKRIMAEALTARAWIYMHFTTLFTKPYSAATAATDQGFAIIKDADINRTYTRVSLQEHYDFMIEDLTTAIPDLHKIVTSRYRATQAVAQAMLGKVYLSMGKFSDALPYLNGAITNITTNTGVVTRIYDYNIEMFAGGALFSASMATSGPATVTLSNNVESLYSRQDINLNSSSINSYFVLSPAVASKYSTADLRRRCFNSTNLPYPAGALRRLWPSFQPTGMNIPEIYLMRAECRARTNSLYGANSAEEDLLFLRQRRMPVASAAVPAGMTQTQMIQFIIDERLREYPFSGLRWFDMRRLSVDPLFSSVTYVHTLYFADGTSQNFPLRPERFTFKIPGRILSDNPEMKDNQ